jgi:uncharacterized protein (DUF924 family)
MPLQHVEDRALQNRSVEVFGELAEHCPQEWKPIMENTLVYARKHQSIVEQFGRFPHRNEILGRESTPEESRWLEEGGDRFGQ